jgi:hypothetical protein
MADCGIDADRRPQTLSVEEWLALAAAIGPLGQPAGEDPGPIDAGPDAGTDDPPTSV